MRPDDELARELRRDRVALNEAHEQAFGEQLHHLIGIPAPERVKGAVVREASIRAQQVSVRMPLDRVPGGGDGDDDSRPAVVAEPFADALGEGLGGALREVEEEFSSLPEDAPQEAWHGQDNVTARNWREHLFLEPLRPQELALLLARRARGPSATRERTKHASPTRRAPKPGKAVFDEATAREPSRHPLDHRPQRAMLPSEADGSDSQQLLEVLLDQTEQR